MNPPPRPEIAEMFSRITPTYDRVNLILSFGLDRFWRRKAAAEIPVKKAEVLDICTGTGELALLLAGEGHAVTGVDVCAPMLETAGKKNPRGKGVSFVQGDALCLPFENESFQAATNAFSLRNLPDLAQAFRETYRILVPGGKAIFLDLTCPENGLKSIHLMYLKNVLPRVGGFISGDAAAYSYLTRSILEFPAAEIPDLLQEAGFGQLRVRPLSFGIATLWSAVK